MDGMRWPLSIAAGFSVMLIVDMFFVWKALHVDDPVDPTYQTTRR